ncbi:MAG: oligosaccharide flippase family protein [Eubacteriales bacterium]|nr:oligosaccharide flippase family protein [Eubacteriales bacterium]
MSDEQNRTTDSSTFLKRLIGFSLAAWVNSAISFIAIPIITRIFLPDELGKIYLFITYTNILLSFAYLGIDQAFTRFYHEPCGKNDYKSLLTVCISLSLIICAIIGIAVIICRDYVSNEILGYVSIVVPICLILSIFSEVLLRYMNLSARMRNNVLLYSVQSITITLIGKVSFVVVALWSPFAQNAILFKTILIFSAAIVFLMYGAKKELSLKTDYSKACLSELFKYAIPIFPATLLIMLNNSIALLMLKRYVDYSAIGIYSNAVSIAGILSILQSGFGAYWPPFVFENYKNGQNKIVKVHHIISFSMVALALIIVISQDLIYHILVGKQYWDSKILLPFLLISPICYTIAETLGLGITIAKKTYLNIPVYIVNVIVNIALCFILLPRIGITGAAIASAVSSICMLIIKSIFGEHLYKCSDNYFKVVSVMSVAMITAVINYVLFDYAIKYLIFISLFVVLVLIYLKEIKYLFSYFLPVLKQYSHK